MKIKMFLRFWKGDTFLFDVKVEEESKKKEVKAEGRAIVSTRLNNGKYAGHCCLDGEDEYINKDIMKQVVSSCVKRALLLKDQVINSDINEPTLKENMIYVKENN